MTLLREQRYFFTDMSHINFISSKRRTVRTFLEASIEAEDLRDILETALKAPTSRNRRATHFVVIEDKVRLDRLSRCKPSGADPIRAGSLAIAVCADTTRAARPYIDCAIAASYIQLAVTDLDLGSCWVHVHDSMGAEEVVRAELGLPPTSAVLCIIAIGLPKDEDLDPRKEDIEWERVFIETFEDRNTVSTNE